MKVTRFDYPLETRLVPKLKAIFKRCTSKTRKRDAVLLFEGPEGEGKTTFSIAVGYYAGEVMNRDFGEPNVFFDLYKLIQFAQKTEGQIIIWDEPALNALSTDSRSAIVADLTRFLVMARKKRHFIMINVAHFNKFNDYIIADRPIGMIKIYTPKKRGTPRFIYIPDRNLRKLWDDWRSKKKKLYFKHASKNCRGTFPDILNPKYKNNVLEEFNIEAYEQKKDDAIGQIGSKTRTRAQKENQEIKYLVATIWKSFDELTQQDVANHFGKSISTLSTWAKRHELVGKTPYTMAQAGISA